jgi:NADH:ubiquinone oxidoreductase subunit E
MARVAELLDVPPAYVRGVATFYTMYNKGPVGTHLVQVCTNVACNLCGGDAVLEAFLEHLDVETGETTPDGLFTVMEVECLGACGFPVAVQINSRYFENVAPEDVPAIVEGLRSGADSSDAADGSGVAAGAAAGSGAGRGGSAGAQGAASGGRAGRE